MCDCQFLGNFRLLDTKKLWNFKTRTHAWIVVIFFFCWSSNLKYPAVTLAFFNFTSTREPFLTNNGYQVTEISIIGMGWRLLKSSCVYFPLSQRVWCKVNTSFSRRLNKGSFFRSVCSEVWKIMNAIWYYCTKCDIKELCRGEGLHNFLLQSHI